MSQTIKDLFGELTAWGRFWLWLGLAALCAAAWMSFMVGLKMTWAHAIFMAILTIVAAFLPEAAYKAWHERKRASAIALAILAAPLFVVEFGQHAAYTAGIRGHELATTKVQNIKYEDARDDVAEAKANLTMFTKRLADIETKQAWAASVTADGLRANIETAQKAIDLETARGGCKAKCLGLMKEKASLEERIKTLEARDDYTGKIEAAKAVIARAREKSAATEHKSSQTEHMNAFLSKAVAFVGDGSLEPNARIEQGTQLSANLAIALAGTGLPALALFIAGLYRKEEDDQDSDTAVGTASPAPRAAPPPAARSVALRTQTIADLRSSLRSNMAA